ncbi:MAG: hypothetical protein ACOCXJ_03380 [Planctomycetota bacterium]
MSRPPIFTTERGLLPLLDVAILLLGLFLVLLAAQAARADEDHSILAGQAIVLLETVPDATDTWRLRRVDSDSGRLVGAARPLDEAEALVRADLLARGSADERPVLVLVQFTDPFGSDADDWQAVHARALQEGLTQRRWTMVWGR